MTLEELTKNKEELDKYRPLPKELADSLDEWYKVELTYTSNAIEGNTLTRQETAEIIARQGKAVKNKSVISKPQGSLTIGRLARETRETVATIRYWTNQGLLKISGKTPGGYQLYSPDQITRVYLIRKSQQEERLKIKEIKGRLS